MSNLTFFVNLLPSYNHPKIDKRVHLVAPGEDKSLCGETPGVYVQTRGAVLQRDPRDIWRKWELCGHCSKQFELKVEDDEIDVPEPPDSPPTVRLRSVVDNDIKVQNMALDAALSEQERVLGKGYAAKIE